MKKQASPRNFITIPVSLWTSPGLKRLRLKMQSPLAEVYLIRSYLFGKDHEKTGQMADRWEDLAACAEWPGTGKNMQEVFRECGLISGDRDLLWEWEDYMGWHLEKYAKDSRRHVTNAAALKAQGAAEERCRMEKAARRADRPRKVTQSGGSVGRSVCSTEDPRRIHGSSAEGKEGSAMKNKRRDVSEPTTYPNDPGIRSGNPRPTVIGPFYPRTKGDRRIRP